MTAIVLIAFVATLALAVRANRVIWRSRLVRAGAGLFVTASALLALFPALVTGLLFAALAPLGLILVLAGSIAAVATRRRRLGQDIDALVAAAQRSGRTWPDDPELPQVHVLAQHGVAAAPALLRLLRVESEHHLNDGAWSLQLEQQAALALCRIYGETPSGGRTVYDPRAGASENVGVKAFWMGKARLH
jgi:hypothetical protein